MPVFHTKTIESILEPVAQQISKLVILHEEADDGNVMPDLSMAVKIVKQAADNLIRVGYETTATSQDDILRQEIPIALQRVEEACMLLQEAASALKSDPKSTNGKRNLIAGERGILHGVSAILLTFDQSEVRKIIKVCEQVLEYLLITEIIEKMDDLVVYVKNITPILAKMTREIDTREKELTHQIHRDLLIQRLEQVKNLTPSFISSIKIHLLIMNALDESKYAEQNEKINLESKNSLLNQVRLCVEQQKEFLIKRLTEEINEIIRILQLTSHDEEDEYLALINKNSNNKDNNNNNIDVSQKLLNFEMNLKPVFEWLASIQNGLLNNSTIQIYLNNEQMIINLLDDAYYLIEAANLNEQQHTQAISNCNTIKLLLDDLCVLANEQKFNTQLAVNTAFKISENLNSLNDILQNSTYENRINQQKMESTNQNSSLSIFNMLEQSRKWCNGNLINKNSNELGELATRLILDEGRKLANSQSDLNLRDDILQVCYECEQIVNKLAFTEQRLTKIEQLENEIMISEDEFKTLNVNRLSLGKHLCEKLNYLNQNITKILIEQVADDFIDIHNPLKKLTEIIKASATSSIDDLSEENFYKCSTDFLKHTQKLCQTARKLASFTTQSRNKRTAELIDEFTNRIEQLAPQIVNAGFIAFKMSDDKSCWENYDLLQQQWQANMEKLQRLVDESLDVELFIRACEKNIVNETYQTQAAVQENNSISIVLNTLNIARRSNRIIQVANQEAENSEDMYYVNQILSANDSLKISLPSMIQAAKTLALQPNNKEFYLIWANSNENLINSIGRVKEAVSNDDINNSKVLANFDSLKIYEESPQTFVRSHSRPASKPTSLPDVIEEENESDFPLPNSNQPILMAAHDLHLNVNQWYSADNDMIAAAKRITLLMAKLSELVRGESNRSKKDLIATARQLAEESMEISRMAKLLAQDCTDKRMRLNLLQVSERIPTIGTQLKILSTVKATMLGSQASKEDEEATDMLIGNAQNLNASVKATVQAAKSASIKVKNDSVIRLKWVKKKSFVKIK